MVYQFLFITLKNTLTLAFFILTTFCSTLNLRIGQLENWRIRFLMSRTGQINKNKMCKIEKKNLKKTLFAKKHEIICQSLMLKFLNASFLYLRFLFLCPILPECVIKRMHRFSLNLFPYMQGFCANTSSIKTLHTCKHEIHKCNESIAEVICFKNSCDSTLFKFD